MIERKPPRTAKPSGAAMAKGAELYQVFRRFVPLEGPLTAASVSAISNETGLGTRRIRELARRFREKPVAESLSSLPRGPKPGSKQAAPEILAAIDGLIAEIYLKKAPPSARLAATRIRNLLIADNGNFAFAPAIVPSVRSIERLIGEISERQRSRTSMGSKQRSAHEPHPGQYLSDGFMDIVQMDHTRADVMLVDSVHRQELGRPWVTLLIEIWSRCILGFYVSFGDPSIFRCGRAVANAVLPKGPLLQSLGLEVEYPMHGLFKRLHADHASAHRASSFRTACLAYGIDPDARPRGPPHFGGHIERLIGTTMGKMLLLPGATGSNATKRDGYDPGEDAGMTFEEFERTFIREICIYHLDPHDGIGGIAPAQKWAEGAATHGALLPAGLDRDELTRRFLPWEERTIHADGIHLHNCRYWHASLATRLGQKLMVHYDERTIQEVYPQIDASYVAATVVGTHPDVCKAEWEAIVAARRQLGQAYQEGGARAETARLIFANYQEVANSKIKTRQLRQSRKRQEREGTSHAVLPASPEKSPVKWVKADELGDDQWVTWLT